MTNYIMKGTKIREASKQKKDMRATKKELNNEPTIDTTKRKIKIKEYTKQTIECPCGVKFLILKKSRHLKSKHHQNYQQSLKIG